MTTPSEEAGAPSRFQRLRERLARRLEAEQTYNVTAYAGYGTPERVRLRGRVLRGAALRPGQPNDHLWRNLHGIYARLESDEVPGASVRLTLGGATLDAQTDSEGYFDEWLTPARLPPALWHSGTGRLLGVGPAAGSPATAQARERASEQPLAEFPLFALVPIQPAFGVISDIDDTVLVSDAAHLLRMAQRLFLGNASTRLPFPGVADFYRALQQGPAQAPGPVVPDVHLNPIFYVSSSPWNLYDLLTDFFALNGVPAGPLFLRDFGLSTNAGAAGHFGHKLGAIDGILALWPSLPFVLIGDSGQQDPEIYTEVVRRHRDRIRAIYIRDVGDDARDRAVARLAAETARAGVPLLLTADSFAARAHAAELGLVAPV